MSNAMGPMVYELRPVVADAHGVGCATTIIAGVMQDIPEHSWNVMVHNGPKMMTALQSRAITCGNIVITHSSYQARQQAEARHEALYKYPRGWHHE